MSSLQEWDLLSDPEHPLNNNTNYESSSPDEFPFDNDGFSLNFKENYSSDEERDSYYRNFRGKKSTTVASDSDTADDLPSSFYNRSTSASFRHPGHQSIPQVLPHTSATSSVPIVSVDPSVSLRPPSGNSTKGSRSNSRSNHLALEGAESKESSGKSNLNDHRRMKKGKERVTERSHKDTLSAAAGGPTSSSMGGDAGLPFPSDNSPAIVDFPRKRPSESSNYSPHSSRRKRRRISAEDCVSESYEFTTSGDTGLGTSSPESSHSNFAEALDTSNSNNCHQSSYAFQTSSDTANQGTSSRRMHDTWHGNSNLEATSKTCSNGVVVINSSPEARGAIVSSHQALNESGPNSLGSNSPIDDLRQIQMEILTSEFRPTTSVEAEFSNIMSSSHNGNDRAGIGTSHQGCEENDSTEVHSPRSGCSHTSTDQEILNLSAFNSFSAQESDLPPSSNRTTGIPHQQRESAHPLFVNSSSNTTGNGDRQSAANQLPSREIVNIDSSDNEVDVNSSTRDSRIASNSSASPYNFTVPNERLTRRTRPPRSNDGPIVISSDDDNFRSRVSPRERDPVRFHFTRTRSRNGETAANSRDLTSNASPTSTLQSNSNRTRLHVPSSEDNSAVPAPSNNFRDRREAWLSEVLESRISSTSELPQQEMSNNITSSNEASINRRRDVAPTRHERLQRMLDQMEMRFPEDFVNRMASSSAQRSTFRDTGILNRRRRVNDRGPMIGRRGRMDPWGWPMNIDDTSDVVAVTERTANGSTSAPSLNESERDRQLREDEELARRLQEEEARAVNPIAAGSFGNMASTSDNRYFGMRAPRAHPAYNDDSRSINIHIPVPPAAGLFPESAFGGNFGRNSRRYNFVSFGGLRSNLGNYMNDDALNSMSYDDLYQLGQTIGSAVNRRTPQNVLDSVEKLTYRNGVLPDDETECPICLCNYADSDIVQRLPCRHHFHDHCVLSWLRDHATCPVCRYNIVQQCHEKDEPKPSTATATASSTSRSPIRAISIRDLLAVPGRGVNRRFRGDYGDHTLPRDRSERHPRFNPNVTARTRGRQGGGGRRESRNAASSVSNADDDIEIVAVRDSGSTRNAVEVDGPRNTRQTARRGGRRNPGQSSLAGSSGGDEGGDGAISSRLRRGRRRN